MNEDGRALVLLYALLKDKGLLVPVGSQQQALEKELRALMTVLNERTRSAIGYDRTPRGVAALARSGS